MTMTSN